mgnify:CR=1 FL=1
MPNKQKMNKVVRKNYCFCKELRFEREASLRKEIQDKVYNAFGSDQAAFMGWLNQMIDRIKILK